MTDDESAAFKDLADKVEALTASHSELTDANRKVEALLAQVVSQLGQVVEQVAPALDQLSSGPIGRMLGLGRLKNNG